VNAKSGRTGKRLGQSTGREKGKEKKERGAGLAKDFGPRKFSKFKILFYFQNI
jgi:hypothetical protein